MNGRYEAYEHDISRLEEEIETCKERMKLREQELKEQHQTFYKKISSKARNLAETLQKSELQMRHLQEELREGRVVGREPQAKLTL